jgi:hypothetical protein
VHFKKNVSLKLKNRIQISGSFSTGFFIEKHRVFFKPGKVQKNGFFNRFKNRLQSLDYIQKSKFFKEQKSLFNGFEGRSK